MTDRPHPTLLGSRAPDPDAVVLAVDIGGTKMAAGIVTGAGQVRDRRQIATAQADRDGDQQLAALVELIDQVRAASTARGEPEPIACGVGCGGPMTRGGEAVSPMNIPAWRDFPLRSRLEAAVDMATIVDNDAK